MRRAQDRARSATFKSSGARSATIEYYGARSATIKSRALGDNPILSYPIELSSTRPITTDRQKLA